jgi:hypothetical protein
MERAKERLKQHQEDWKDRRSGCCSSNVTSTTALDLDLASGLQRLVLAESPVDVENA